MEPARIGDPGSRLYTWGVRGWLLTGVGLGAVVAVTMAGAVSGLAVPLVIAVVLAAIFAPVVDALAHARIPRSVGSLLVIALLAGIIGVSIWLVVVGVADQSAQISASGAAGLDAIEVWLREQGVLSGDTSLRGQVDEVVSAALGGASAYLPGLLSSTASFVLGTAIGTFLLYYVLADWPLLTHWVGRHIGWDARSGTAMVTDAVGALRRYFSSLTISAVVTAVLIGGAARLLDVPLAFTIAVITLVTSYVPYLGAIFSGAFAVLITLGAAGPRPAVVMLVVVLVVQNVVQTIVLTRLTSSALRMHPIVTLGSTIVGAALAGALGAMLSSPAVAVWILIVRRLRDRPGLSVDDADGRTPESVTAAREVD